MMNFTIWILKTDERDTLFNTSIQVGTCMFHYEIAVLLIMSTDWMEKKTFKKSYFKEMKWDFKMTRSDEHIKTLDT